MAVSFATDIKPMFRAVDIEHMKPGVLLDDYGYMSNPINNHEHAQVVYARLSGNSAGKRMPPGGPYWNEAQLKLFAQWMADGYQA
jgi:hypothetical protein